MIRLIKQHTFIFFYFIIYIFIVIGVYYRSQWNYIGLTSIYGLSFILFYFILYFLKSKKKFNISILERINFTSKNISRISWICLTVIIIFIIYHFFYIGKITIVQAWESHNSIWIAKLRQNISGESSTFINYTSSFILKGFIPFFLFYFFFSKKKVEFILLLVFSVFYAIELLQKSFMVTIFLPLIVCTFLQKKYLVSSGFFLFVLSILVLLVMTANPRFRGEIDTADDLQMAQPISGGEGISGSLMSICKRTILCPGETVSDWFKLIPSKHPFLHGNGYRFISPFIRGEYHDYATELYKDIYPQYNKVGLHGTVNSANFMYDYANFGWIGLILSGFMIALLFIFLEIIFQILDFKIKISLNLFPVFILSSTSITSAMFSGGWSIIILLLFVFKEDLAKTFRDKVFIFGKRSAL